MHMSKAEREAMKWAIFVPFGETVRARRLALGLRQKDVDLRMGLTGRYVCGIECGDRNPELATLHRLAHALELSTHELLSQLPPPDVLPGPYDVAK